DGGQSTPSTVWAEESGATSVVDLTSNAVTARSISFASADPTIAIVDSTGKVTGVGPGMTYISAAYNGLVATHAVEVIGVPTPPTALIHRYTFDDGTANDSIGTKNGRFYNASGQSSISGGQLNLAGVSGDFVDLGSDIIATNALGSGAFSL